MAEKRLYRSTVKQEGSYLIEISDHWIEYHRASAELLPDDYELVACISEVAFLQAALGRRIKYKPTLN